MNHNLTIGSRKEHRFTVSDKDLAAFADGVVHPVCSTFVLGREMEWCSRLFVLDMKNEDEEGIGTMLNIQHKAPALLGDLVVVDAIATKFSGNELICVLKASVGNREIAFGTTGQKILKKKKIQQIFDEAKRND